MRRFFLLGLAAVSLLVPTTVLGEPGVDPAQDRTLFFPTARILPRGDWAIANYDLLVFQGSYAFHDDAQVSLAAMTIPPAVVLVPSIKWRLVRRGRTEGAILVGLGGAADFSTNWRAMSPSAAALVTHCIHEECTLDVNVVVWAGAFASTRGVDIWGVGGLTASYRLGSRWKVFLGGYGHVAMPETQAGFLVPYGGRLYFAHFALDLGFALPLGTERGRLPAVTPIGNPLLALTFGW